jgi:creatinine amidohydrolase
MGPGILAEMCRADFEKWKPEVAVIPIGATEVHAWHLPFGTDNFEAESVTRRAVEAANNAGGRVLMVPTIPYGVDGNLLAFPYTIHMPPSTLLLIVRDIVASMTHHGVKKFLLVNGHGGNTAAVQTITRELYGKAFIASIDWWNIAWDVVKERMETNEFDHADEFETSISLAHFPELVRMDKAEKTQSNAHKLPLLKKYGGNFSRPWEHYTKNGGVGDPTRATAEKGNAVLDAAVARLKEVRLELSKAPMTEKFPY